MGFFPDKESVVGRNRVFFGALQPDPLQVFALWRQGATAVSAAFGLSKCRCMLVSPFGAVTFAFVVKC